QSIPLRSILPTDPSRGSKETNLTDACAFLRCLSRTAFFASSTDTPSQMWGGALPVPYRLRRYLVISELRLVRTWKVCQLAASIVSNTESMKGRGISL